MAVCTYLLLCMHNYKAGVRMKCAMETTVSYAFLCHRLTDMSGDVSVALRQLTLDPKYNKG
jgi:hypothetical protein